MGLKRPSSGETAVTELTVIDGATFDTTTLVVDDDNNRIGINTATPSASLEIDGDIQLTPTAISTAHVKTTGSLDVRCTANMKLGTDGADSVRIGRTNTTGAKIHLRSGADTDLVVSNSKVGIGTETPKTDLTVEGTITLKEQAEADADTAAYGQIWVNTATPNELYYTTDAGDDIQITSGTSLAATGDITGVTAGVGLSGGGASGAVTLTLDLSELSTVTPADGDFFATLDSDGANEQKTTTTALATLLAGTGLTASSSVIGVDASQTQITGVGTVTTGVWNGTAIASAYLDADTAHLSGAQTFTGAKSFTTVLDVINATTSSATQGGKLSLTADDGAAMAQDHRLGVIEFKGAEDGSATRTIGARIQATCDAGWSASENGASLEFYTTDGDASESLVLKMDSDKRAGFEGAVDAKTSLTVLNTTTSAADQGGSLVLQCDDGAAMASGHRLGVIEFQGAEDGSATQTTGARIEALTDAGWSASENGASLLFYTTDANASQSEVLKLDSDKLATFAGALTVTGNVTLPDVVLCGKWLRHADDVDTQFVFHNAGDIVSFEAGGVEIARISEGAQDEFVVNDLSNDVDFRAESNDETHMLFVDAGSHRVSIGSSTDAPAAILEVTNKDSGTGATGVPLLQFNSVDTDQICMDINASNIDADVMNITADAVTTSAAINISADGLTTGNIMKLVSDSNSTATRTLVEIVNDNTAATDTTVMKLQNDAITPAGTLTVESSANDPNPLVELVGTYNAADRPVTLKFSKINGAADDYDIAKISFSGENDADPSEPIEYAQILVEASDTTDGDEGGQITISIMAGGTAGTASLTQALKIGREDAAATDGAYALMMNDTNADLNVKMKSVNNNNILFMDAGNDRLGLGKGAPTSTVHIKGSFCKEVTNQTGATLSITEAHSVVTCDTSSNNVECDLPATSGITGRIYTFIKTHASNSMILDPSGSELIYKAASPSGGATITYGDIGSTVTLQCTSIGWVVLSEYVPT